ncbi:MAG: 4-hydroxy-tetrahydrodipicolinate reductase [Bacteroidetes bacterium]|nr:4-hydroxy-tetrahydrodipicolinate reductase [Bacteroidota bacterium]
MNIAVIGYGRFGKEIERQAVRLGHTVPVLFTSHYPVVRHLQEHTGRIDCCIDVSVPAAVLSNVRTCADAGIPVVLGTTGWQQYHTELLETVRDRNGTLIYGSNFSVGAHILFALVRAAAAMADHLPEYDVSVSEVHHRLKTDSPSGTALTIAREILSHMSRKSAIHHPDTGPIRPHELSISSSRIGTVPGTHSVLFHSAADEIELVHRAHDRSGFAAGAVRAAELTAEITGIHRFDDLVRERFLHLPS